MMAERLQKPEEAEQAFSNHAFFLRPHDQKTLAWIALVLMVAATTSTAWYAWRNGGVMHYDNLPERTIAFQVDVNEADWTELSALPEIGPSVAKAIVAHREQFGPFTSLHGLRQVSGIGRRTIEQVRPYLTELPAVDSFEQVARRSDE